MKIKDKYIYDPITGKMNVYTNVYKHNGYEYFHIKKKKVMTHIYAWYFMTGEWPNNWIDHKDTNKLNNRWNNLREASKSQNAKNRKKIPGKYIGVRKKKRGATFEWRMRTDYKEIHVSGFRCPTVAAIARDKYILSIGDEFSTLNVLERKSC